MTLNLEELTRLLDAAPAPPVGFIVSQELYDGLRARLPIATTGGALAGVPMVVDPKLPAKEFEVANTQAVWRKRLAEIKEARS